MTDKLYQLYLKSTGISTDTRTIKPGNLFFALSGPNFNANTFAEKAIESGAVAAVVDDPQFTIPGKTFLVDNSLATLQDLARHHRRQLMIPVIGITGSNGKTTTKELIRNVLNTNFRTFATRGNFNNHIGVPLSVLSIKPDHEIAVIEMGANHIGEIAFLCEIAQPTHGLITNIGKAHTGLFGGFEGVLRAKSELYDFLIKNEGTIFVNQNQDILMNMSKRMKNPVFYPNEGSYCHVELVSADPWATIRYENGEKIGTKLIGSYNFDNIATALCVGKFFGVPADKALDAVAFYEPDNNRSQVIEKGSNTIILDAYNANPSSMEKAIENLAMMKGAKKIAILGDMFELGDDTKAEHEKTGILLRKHQIHDALFCGDAMKYAQKSYGGGHYAPTKDELIKYLKSHKIENALILIKASRGMALEDVVDYL